MDIDGGPITTAISLRLANERVESGADLARWLEAEGILEPSEIQEVSLRMPEFRAVRSASREVFEASMNGEELPVDAVEHLNEVSARVPRVLVLAPPVAREASLSANATARTLARVAWSAIELVAGPDRDRLRRCGSCGDLFLATRSDRVWCSDACGNRVRVARHHAKRRAGR